MGQAPRISTKVTTTIAAAFVVVLLISAGLFSIYEKQYFERNINARAERMLTSLEAVHVQSMLHRSGTDDGDPVIEALNAIFQHMSRYSGEDRVWLVMGPSVLAFQTAQGASEIEPPRDAVDELAISSGVSVSRIVGGDSLRVTKPVVLGEGSAAAERCFDCHADIIGARAGSVLGAYAIDLSIAADREKYLTSVRAALALAVLAAIGVTLATGAWFKRALGGPLSGMSTIMDRLAGGDLAVSVPDTTRNDEIGDMARAVEVFKSKAIEARELELRFAEAQRRATMGEMASTLAHELAQPLAAINAYCTGALRRLSGENWRKDEVTDVLQKAADMTHRASAIIRSIAAQASGRPPRHVDASINEVVDELLPLLESEVVRNHVALEVKIGEDLPNVPMDEVGIGSVILNIAHNGVEAMLQQDETARHLIIETRLRGDDQIEVSVTDSGPGLLSDAAERLFDPFFTTKSSGMGMGLAICRSIVEAHGGRIWVDRPESGGCTLKFSLPIKRAEQVDGD